jgi:hypothetical protein
MENRFGPMTPVYLDDLKFAGWTSLNPALFKPSGDYQQLITYHPHTNDVIVHRIPVRWVDRALYGSENSIARISVQALVVTREQLSVMEEFKPLVGKDKDPIKEFIHEYLEDRPWE